MLKTRTSKKNSSNKKLIDSQESPACRGKNNILGRDLDIYKKCILKESKLEANKNNMKWHSLHNNIICLNEFKRFQFETELALQTAALRQHIDESYAWMAPDDREKLFARWTRRIRADLLDRFDAPRSEWKERFINEGDFDEEDNDDLTTNDDSRGTSTPSSRRGVESEMGQHDNYENESIKTKDSIDQKFEDFKKILESTEEQRLSVVLFASKAKTSNYCIYKFEKNGFFEKNFKQPIQAKSTFKTFRPEEQIKEEQQFKKDYLLKMERRKIDENRKRVKKFLSVESFYTI